MKKHSLVPVIGASGSGKSSVVLAGLIPKLRAEGWLIESFRPQSEPFYKLAAALVRVRYPKLKDNENEQGKQTSNLFTQMEGNRKLWQEVADILEKKADILENESAKGLLLVIDQFEELYDCDNKKEVQKFVDELLKAIDKNSGLRIVLTIRHEFIDKIANNPDFKKQALKKGNPQYLGAMNREEIKSVIELIDANTQNKIVELEDGLTQQILDDVQEEPGKLPLLEFALTQLWEQSNGGRLTLNAYRNIGSLRKALANYADEIYKELNDQQKTQMQQIFVQLARPGKKVDVANEDQRQGQSSFIVKDTRQLATRAEIGEDNWRLVQQKFVGVDLDTPNQQKKLPLLVTGWNEKTREQTVEVVHEALIREWKKLQEWINNDRDFLTWRDQLRTQREQWKTDRDSGALLRGKPLDVAENWLQKHGEDLRNEREYIQQSVRLRKSQERQIVMTNIARISSVVLLIVVLLLTIKESIILMFITANKKHLSKQNLENFQLPKANLSEANLSGANLSKANLEGSDLARAKLQRVKLVNTYMPRAKLQDADLSKANLSKAIMTGADLSSANLQGADLVETYMPGAKLQDADLSKANLSKANIDGADLSRAKLQGANLVKTYMPKANLQDADLSRADLSGKETHLDQSDLSRAKLQGANLVQTYMPGAKLQDADLSQANLSEANIDGADLLRANLQGAKSLKPDQVKRAKNWEKAKYDKDFSEQLGLTASKEVKK